MHATFSTMFKTTEGKRDDSGPKRNPTPGFPQEQDPKHRTLLSSPVFLKRDSLRSSLNRNVKSHDLPETHALTWFLILKAEDIP